MTWLLMLLITMLGPPGGAAAPGSSAGGVTIALAPAQPTARAELPSVTPARGIDPPLVVIDAGHGGHDPGASSSVSPVPEKDVTLALARAIRDALARSGRVRAALTRDDDRFLDLHERYAIARRLRADLFISVH